MKKYIPMDIVWSGKFYKAGSIAEVGEDLSAAIEAMNPPKEDEVKPEMIAKRAKKKPPEDEAQLGEENTVEV